MIWFPLSFQLPWQHTWAEEVGWAHVWGPGCQSHHAHYGHLQGLLQVLHGGETQLWLWPVENKGSKPWTVHCFGYWLSWLFWSPWSIPTFGTFSNKNWRCNDYGLNLNFLSEPPLSRLNRVVPFNKLGLYQSSDINTMEMLQAKKIYKAKHNFLISNKQISS